MHAWLILNQTPSRESERQTQRVHPDAASKARQLWTTLYVDSACCRCYLLEFPQNAGLDNNCHCKSLIVLFCTSIQLFVDHVVWMGRRIFFFGNSARYFYEWAELAASIIQNNSHESYAFIQAICQAENIGNCLHFILPHQAWHSGCQIIWRI